MTGKHWITISGPARVSSLAEKPIDRATLARFHGVVDDSVQDLAEYVDEQELVRVGVHGGAIALRFDDTSGVLFVESTYAVDVPLSDALALPPRRLHARPVVRRHGDQRRHHVRPAVSRRAR